METKYKTKCVVQVLIYLIEVIGISAIATAISAHISPIHNFMEWPQRWCVFYAIYQVLVIVIATNINDIHKDSWLVARHIYQLCQLLLENNDAATRPLLIAAVTHALDKNSILLPEAREMIQMIDIDEPDIKAINRGLLVIDRQMAVCELRWRYSLLLRLFK